MKKIARVGSLGLVQLKGRRWYVYRENEYGCWQYLHHKNNGGKLTWGTSMRDNGCWQYFRTRDEARLMANLYNKYVSRFWTDRNSKPIKN
jgi:hypothetical protein